MLSRRTIMRAIGLAPAALVTKEALDLKSVKLTTMVGLAGDLSPVSSGHYNNSITAADRGLFRLKLAMPDFRAHLESVLYEQERIVAGIDYDIASKRSFSVAAKVTFQRQRNVERRLQAGSWGSSWERIKSIAGMEF